MRPRNQRGRTRGQRDPGRATRVAASGGVGGRPGCSLRSAQGQCFFPAGMRVVCGCARGCPHHSPAALHPEGGITSVPWSRHGTCTSCAVATRCVRVCRLALLRVSPDVFVHECLDSLWLVGPCLFVTYDMGGRGVPSARSLQGRAVSRRSACARRVSHGSVPVSPRVWPEDGPVCVQMHTSRSVCYLRAAACGGVLHCGSR